MGWYIRFLEIWWHDSFTRAYLNHLLIKGSVILQVFL